MFLDAVLKLFVAKIIYYNKILLKMKEKLHKNKKQGPSDKTKIGLYIV